MRKPIIPLIERAVLIAVASCGTSTTQPDGGLDASTDTSVLPDASNSDVSTDAGLDGKPTIDVVPPLPLPDGCVVTGKPDAFAPCGYTESLNDPTLCGVILDASIQESGVCYVLCNPSEPDCAYFGITAPDGATNSYLSCGVGCIGRMHEEARRAAASACAHASTSPGEYLARAALLEAEAVFAFDIVASDLARFGAPAELIDAARRASADEAEHARVVGELAKRFGGVPATPTKPSPRTQNLVTFAIENAIEGCVRETFGAALALWQAERAADESARNAMRAIAADEARHAELGWSIDAWLATVLTSSQRTAVRAARDRAVRDLRTSIEASASDETLGLPTPRHACMMFDALEETLWS